MIQSSSAGDVGAHVAEAPLHVEHDIGDPLAGSVIGELAAAPGPVHGKAGGCQQVVGLALVPAV